MCPRAGVTPGDPHNSNRSNKKIKFSLACEEEKAYKDGSSIFSMKYGFYLSAKYFCSAKRYW